MACSDLPCGCQVSPRQGGTLDIRYRTNFASTSTFSPWPPPSLYTPRDSLEAEVTQGFLVTPRGKPSGKCVSWQGVTLRRPTAAPEIRVEAEQLRGGGRGRGGTAKANKSQLWGLGCAHQIHSPEDKGALSGPNSTTRHHLLMTQPAPGKPPASITHL